MWAFGVDEGGRGEGRRDGIWEGKRREKWEGFEGGAADLGRNGWPNEKALKTPNEDRKREGGEGKEEAGAADYGSRMANGQKIHRRLKGGRRWKKANWGIGRDWALFTNMGLGSFYQYSQNSHQFFQTILLEAMKVGN
jgi:ribosomal protein L27